MQSKICIALFLVVFICENIFTISGCIGVRPDMLFLIQSYAKFVISYLFIACFLVFLPRIFSYFIVFANFLINIFILTYQKWIMEPPSLTSILDKTEVLQSGFKFYHYVDYNILFSYAIIFLLESFLLHHAVIHFKNKKIHKAAVALPAIALMLFWMAYSRHKNFSFFEISQAWDVSQNIARRGFIPFWFAELFDKKQWEEEKRCSASRVENIELPPLFDKNNIIYIQVESLDYDLVDYSINGTHVVPFLHSLAKTSILFKLDGKKIAYSSNSDYELLCTKQAQSPYIAYKKSINFNECIPTILASQGYDVFFFDGDNILFEKDAYKKMGATRVFSAKDMEASGFRMDRSRPLPQICDADIFSFAEMQLRPEKKNFTSIITISMHDPDESLDMGIFKDSQYPSFFATAYLTDKAIKSYITKLPKGTLVIIMGDHIPHYGLKSGFVPAIVHITGNNIEKKIPGIYSRCEFSHYLRKLFGIAKDASLP